VALILVFTMSKRVCNLILAHTWSMHSVLPLKLDVTKWYQSRVDCRNVSLYRNGRTKDFIIIEAFSFMLALLLLTLLLLLPHSWANLDSLPCACFSSHPFCLTIYLILHCTTDGSPFEDFSCWCGPPVCSAGIVQRLPWWRHGWRDRDGACTSSRPWPRHGVWW
jgi:hypothetical protein